MHNTKVIAYYLPQFHEIPENNIWWGKGYTEWENARKAKALYWGQYQPKEPYQDNYYNLLDINVMQEQARLAKKYGVYGFAFYHYWFGDKRMMLEKPAENLLKHPEVNMRFCFSWANENWTRTWEGPGGEREVLMSQKYGDEEDWKAHFDYMLPFFRDKRYIKKDGKPVLLIYRLDKIPCHKNMFRYWRELAEQEGLPGLYIIQMFRKEEEKRRGVDAYTFYVPAAFAHAPESESVKKLKEKLADIVKGRKIPLCIAKNLYDMFDYDESYQFILNRHYKDNEYMGAFTDFDSTARKGKHARIWYGATPRKFCEYFSQLYSRSNKQGKDFMFVTAWNEWGEGNYLEPDKKYGYGWLKAIRTALEKHREG